MQESKQRIFWRSIQPLVGSVIGVGIFGLPFVFAQSGFFIALVYLLVLAFVNAVLLLAFGDIIINTSGHPRFTGVVNRYLGKAWSWVATVLMFGATWGAMIAYIIIGGTFLHVLLSPVIGGGLIVYQCVFFFVSSFLLIGGLGFITRLEVFFVLALLVMLFVILAGAVPYAEFSNLTNVDSANWFLPFGVILFAFGGLAAVPEMAHVLGRQKQLLRRGIIVGISIISFVYIAFSGIIVAVTGSNTSEEAIVGLGSVLGNWAIILGSVIGLFSVLTSFLILGVSVMDTMIFDFKRRYFASWFFTIAVPFILFIFGARSFIHVIGFTGGLLGGLLGVLAIYTYLKAKKHACVPKRCLLIPNWVLYLCVAVFSLGAILTLFGV
ncbi:MAG: aromatic amino acid transport family protein [Candidatus Uhrbacteria bacterium]|nr:aromatic amino acid transport family protein [Candidatus Uhrbacteria bacterium]